MKFRICIPLICQPLVGVVALAGFVFCGCSPSPTARDTAQDVPEAAGEAAGKTTVAAPALDAPAEIERIRAAVPEFLPEPGIRASPFLLFKDEEMAELRANSRSGVRQEFRQRLDTLAAEYQKLASPKYDAWTYQNRGRQEYSGGTLASHVLTTAFSGILEENPERIEAAKSILMQSLDQVDLLEIRRSALTVGNILWVHTLAYDWLYPYLTDAERDRLRDAIRVNAQWIYEESTAPATAFSPNAWGSDDPGRLSWNWNGVMHGPLGLAGLLLGESSWTRRAAERSAGHLVFATDAAGAPYESNYYRSYGANQIMPFVVALERLTGRSLLELAPNAGNFVEYLTYTLLPGQDGFVPINQGGETIERSAWLNHIWARDKNPLGRWLFDRLYVDAPGEPRMPYQTPQLPNHGPVLPFNLLWFGDSTAPAGPEALNLPTSRLFPLGFVAARTGWGPHSTLATFKSSRIRLGWNHPDQNSFTFYSGGQGFAVDTGTHQLSGLYHNTLEIDGRPTGEKDRSSTLSAKMLDFEDRGDWVIASGDSAESYPDLGVREVIRRIVFGRAPQPYLLVTDEVTWEQTPTHPTRFRFLSYSDPGMVPELLDERVFLPGTREDGPDGHVFVLSPQEYQLEALPAARRFQGFAISTESDDGTPRFAVLYVAAKKGEPLPKVSTERTGEDLHISLRFETEGFTDHLTLAGKNILTKRIPHEVQTP